MGRWVYLLLGAGIVGMAAAGLQIARHVQLDSGFHLAALEVQGLKHLSGREVLQASGLGVGDNIFAVDLPQVAARLERLHWVEKAWVERKPPNRLLVSIVERRRLAWLGADSVYGVDGAGVLLPGSGGETHGGALDLPLISGLSATDSLRLGAVVPDSTLLAVLAWWERALSCDAEFCRNVSEIQPLAHHCVRLYLVGDGLEVRLPMDRAPERLAVLKKLIRRIYREGPEPGYIDLRFAGQAVVGTRAGAVALRHRS